MKNTQKVQVVPEIIQFCDVESGRLEEVDVYVKNISRNPILIRFSIPNDSPFSLVQKKPRMIAPGLETSAKIKFVPVDSSTIESFLRIHGDDFIKEVPVIVMPPTSSFVINKTEFDFGVIPIQTQISDTFIIQNVGSISADYLLSCDDIDLKINPQRGILNPGQKKSITMSFMSSNIGNHISKIEISSSNIREKIPTVIVRSNVDDKSVELFYNGVQSQDISIGSIFFGEKKVVQVQIKNFSPVKRSFVFKPPFDPKNNDFNRNGLKNDEIDSVFSVIPTEGVIDPNSSSNVSIVFCPKSPKIIDSIEYLYNYQSTINIIDTNQIIDVQMNGIGVIFECSLSRVNFDFGSNLIKDKKEQTIVLKNKSKYLPLTFSFPNVAHFHFVPQTGIIQPLFEKSVSIVFCPNQIGCFNNEVIISFNEGLSHQRIFVTGSSCYNDAIGDIFKRSPIWETDKNANYSANHPDIRYGLSMEDIEKKNTLREEFHNYITEYAKKRHDIKAKKDFINHLRQKAQIFLENTRSFFSKDDVDDLVEKELKNWNNDDEKNLGLDHAEGLPEPEQQLNIGYPPLPIADPLKLGLISNSSTENRAISGRIPSAMSMNQVFKPKPTTPPEIMECSKQLSPSQQISVIASHQTISFGTISVFSSETRSFTITNSLQQFIIVEFLFELEELSSSKPSSQVIPPLQTATFSITFCSKHQIQNYLNRISYTINHCHVRHINISAQVIPIDVRISKTTIDFVFPRDYTKSFLIEQVSIYNNSNSRAKFKWNGFNSVFTIKDESGIIEPKSNFITELTYQPGSISKSEVFATLSIEGGQSRNLKCTGDSGKPKCQVIKKVIDFGLVPLGSTQNQIIRIKNNGNDDGIFSISCDENNLLNFQPNNGRIPANSSFSISLTMICQLNGKFSIPLTINICGQNPISINIEGNAQLPSVSISNGNIDFGKVFIGSSSTRGFSIENIGNIPAVLYFDFSDHHQFRLDYSSEISSSSQNSKTNSVSVVDAFDPSFLPNTRFDKTQTKLNRQSSRYLNTIVFPRGKMGLMYQVSIMEKSSMELSLVFRPDEIGDFSFDLPINMIQKPIQKTPFIIAESIHSPLVINNTTIDFGVSPLFDISNPNSRPIIKEIVMKNEFKSKLYFRLNQTTGSCFSPDKSNGIIEYSSSESIFISFKPLKAIPYDEYVSLYAITDNEEFLISRIQLVGIGSSRQFRTSTDYVCLPIVPLGIKVSKTIQILNICFIQSEIRAELPLNEKNFPVSISFPEGNKLDYTKSSIPLEISFISQVPLSFSTIVALINEKGNVYSFNLSATADSSIFTLYPFFKNNKVNYSIGQNKYPYVSQTTDLINEDFFSAYLSKSSFADMGSLPSSNSNESIDLIIRFINGTNPKMNIMTFPDDFIINDGSSIFELIEYLGGKIPSNMNIGKGSPNKNNADSRKEAFKNLIQFLMSQGALLSSIKPEFLLSKDDFLLFLKQKIIRQLSGVDYPGASELEIIDTKTLMDISSTQPFITALLPQLKYIDQIYSNISMESWTFVILQIIKLFNVNKITQETILSTPGIHDSIKNMKGDLTSNLFNQYFKVSKFSQSNYLCVPELSLLFWGSFHYHKHQQTNSKLFLRFSDLSNQYVLMSIICSHIPRFSHRFIWNSQTEEDRNQNINNLVEIIKYLKIPYPINYSDIISQDPFIHEIVLYGLFLYIPHYIPSNNLEYSLPLSSSLTQSIALHNPSDIDVCYSGSIEGSPNFRMIHTSVIVASHQSADFSIEYTARSHISEKALLTLVPTRPKSIKYKHSTVSISHISESSRSSIIKKPSQSSRSIEKKLNNSLIAEQELSDGINASTVIVELFSSVYVNSVSKTITIEGPLYESTSFDVMLSNYASSPGHFKLFSSCYMICDGNGIPIKESPSQKAQIELLMLNPNMESGFPDSMSQFEKMIHLHKSFIFNSKEIEIPINEKKKVSAEFIPISLGTYRCIVLFKNDGNGEFLYEIIGKSKLPENIDLSMVIKSEAKNNVQSFLPIEVYNSSLFKALAYSYEKLISYTSIMSERKFRDTISLRTKEIQTIFLQCCSGYRFAIECSSNHFSFPKDYTIPKSSFSNNSGGIVQIPFSFVPIKAGDYPCRVLLFSNNDVRVYSFVGVGIAPTKKASIEIQTITGKTINQTIPFVNPSNTIWQFKASLTGDIPIVFQNRFFVSASSTYEFPISLMSKQKGVFKSEMVFTNITKETDIAYTISVVVDDPPAQEKISLNVTARKEQKFSINLPSFISSGHVSVSSTIPIISFPSTMVLEKDNVKNAFEYTVYALRSGISAGIITFTEIGTGFYIWYIVEITVDPPIPEETISAQTVCRTPVIINIPISNPKPSSVSFSVQLSHADLKGLSEISVPSLSTEQYSITFLPMKQLNRVSSVSFFNEIEGEYIYLLNLIADPPEINVLSLLSCPVGKYVSTYITIDNPYDHQITASIDNDNELCFQVLAKTNISLTAHEVHKIEIRYIPSSVGIKENGLLTIRSNDIGDWQYKMSGIGKPPQPLSPIIVEGKAHIPSSSIFEFSNPFRYPSKFQATLLSEPVKVFEFLQPRKLFKLSYHGEQIQIPFSFIPPYSGQFKGTLVITSVGHNSISWTIPIIGNSSITDGLALPCIRSRSGIDIHQTMNLPLIGEREDFDYSDYSMSVDFPQGYEWISKYLELRIEKIKIVIGTPNIVLNVSYRPKRPLEKSVSIVLENPLNQKWVFSIDLLIISGEPVGDIELECSLKKTVTTRVCIKEMIPIQTPFHAYFASGSAPEFSVKPEKGLFEPSISEIYETPCEISFKPQIYGKLMKGLLVIDTLEAQYIFNVFGRIPKYKPPIIKQSNELYKPLPSVRKAKSSIVQISSK